MDWDGWPTAEQWSAWWAFATFAVAAVAAFVALRQFRAYVEEQEDRARPYLIVDFEFRSMLVMVKVENISSTPATNVRMLATPMVVSPIADRAVVLEKVFGGDYVIPQMAPGRSITWLVGAAHSLFVDHKAPEPVTVMVEYTDPRAKPGKGPYHDTFTLDLDQYGQASMGEDWENKHWNIASRNERRLEDIKGSLASVARTLDYEVERGEVVNATRRREPMSKRRRRNG